MRFGAHTFIWEGDWDNATAGTIIGQARRAGLDLVEVPLLRPQEFDAERTRSLLQENKLAATFSLGLPKESKLPEHPVEAERFLRGAIEQVAAAGGSVLTGVIYGTLGESPQRPPNDDDYRAIAACLKQVARYAATIGIRLGIEPVNRYETYLVNTAAQAVRLLDMIDEANLFIHLDTYHLNIEERGMREPILAAGKRLGYMHLSESHRGTPGSGTVDWDQVFGALRDIDFDGDLVMESFVKLNPDIARATCMWRDVVGDPQALVRDGLAFLRAKVAEYHLD